MLEPRESADDWKCDLALALLFAQADDSAKKRALPFDGMRLMPAAKKLLLSVPQAWLTLHRHETCNLLTAQLAERSTD
jgi:hypothetical protein